MKYVLAILITFLLTSLTAQVTSAKVIYEETTQLNLGKKGKDPAMQALLSQLPKSHSNDAVLTFNETAANYQELPYQGKEMKAESGTNKLSISFQMEDPEVYYYDLKDQLTKQKRKIFDREFFIEDAIEPIEWSVTEEKMTGDVTQLDLIKATGINYKGDTITAWYTPGIPVSTGPDGIMGLPGLVIKATVGDKSYQATSIEVLAPETKIDPPFENEKTVSLAKFRKTEKAKMDAFYKKAKASGSVIIE